MSYVSDINEIPVTTIPPPSCKVHQEDMTLNVYCDVETTSIQSDCDIMQLAAVFGDKTSNKYISPPQHISQGAAEVTGLTVSDNRMFQRGKPVESESLYHVLVLFRSWLLCVF